MGKAGFTVTTWANGYGAWQAEVTVPHMSAYGPQVQRAARKAILHELSVREMGTENIGVRFVGILGDKVRYEEVPLNER